MSDADDLLTSRPELADEYDRSFVNESSVGFLKRIHSLEESAMHTKVRRSALKHKKSTGFRTRMKTRGGRLIIKRRRRMGRKLPGAV